MLTDFASDMSRLIGFQVILATSNVRATFRTADKKMRDKR